MGTLKFSLLTSLILISTVNTALAASRLDIMEASSCLNCALQKRPDALLDKVHFYGNDHRDDFSSIPALASLPVGLIINDKPVIDPHYDPKIKNSTRMAITESTGFLVSPCHILATFHGVFGKTKNPNTSDFSVTFAVGFDSNGKPKHVVHAVPVAGLWGSNKVTQDYVLLRDASCVGALDDVGWTNLENYDESLESMKSLYIAGFPGDKDDHHLWGNGGCQVKVMKDGDPNFLHNCPGTYGNSGSPIFALDELGVPSVIGLYTGEFNKSDLIEPEYTDRVANFGIRADVIRTAVFREIRSALKQYPIPNPQIAIAAQSGRLNLISADPNNGL